MQTQSVINIQEVGKKHISLDPKSYIHNTCNPIIINGCTVSFISKTVGVLNADDLLNEVKDILMSAYKSGFTKQ